MATTDGIIHSFPQRRRLEAEIAALGDTDNETALRAAVQKIVDTYPVDLLLTTVVRHLATPDSQVRGGLGLLCALLPKDEVVPTLRGVAGNRQKTPQERTTAVLIMDRYLGEPAPPALLADLAGSADVPYQSLLEAVAASRRNRHVLLEYVTQMQEHAVDTAFMVLGLIDRLPPADQVELLRLIAQDSRPQVARSALDRLANLATGEAARGRIGCAAHAAVCPAAGHSRGCRTKPAQTTVWGQTLSAAVRCRVACPHQSD